MKRKTSPSRKISRAELSKFRSQIRALRDAGKLPGKKIDLRTVTPNTRRGGKPLTDYLKKSSRKKLAPLNSPISIRDFPLKHKSLAGVLADLEENAEELDMLKKPDERWALQIDGIRSYALFYNMRQLAQVYAESAGIQEVLKKRQDANELYSGLKLVRWNKSAAQWKPKAQKRKKASHAARQAKSRKKGKKK